MVKQYESDIQDNRGKTLKELVAVDAQIFGLEVTHLRGLAIVVKICYY